MDRLSKEQRRKNMQAIKSKDSEIEIKLRNELWSRGYRYQKNRKDIYGKPDIVFLGLKIAIFCDSEFWHGYDWENRKMEIKSNKEFWINKIESNIKRDEEVNRKLREDGWIVLRFWAKEIQKDIDKCVLQIESEIKIRKANKY